MNGPYNNPYVQLTSSRITVATDTDRQEWVAQVYTEEQVIIMAHTNSHTDNQDMVPDMAPTVNNLAMLMVINNKVLELMTAALV